MALSLAGCSTDEPAATDETEPSAQPPTEDPPSAEPATTPEPTSSGPLDADRVLDLDGFTIRLVGSAALPDVELGAASATPEPDHHFRVLRIEVTRTADTPGLFTPAEFLHLRVQNAARDAWLGGHHGCQIALPQSMVREITAGETAQVNACWQVPSESELELGVTRNLYAAADVELASRWTLPEATLELPDLIPTPAPVGIGDSASLDAWTLEGTARRTGSTLGDLRLDGADADTAASDGRTWVAIDLRITNGSPEDRAALPVQLHLAEPDYELWAAPALPCMQALARTRSTDPSRDDTLTFPAAETVDWTVCFEVETERVDASDLALDALIGLSPEPERYLRFALPAGTGDEAPPDEDG